MKPLRTDLGDEVKVFVYRNLHKKCFSVKAMEGPMKGRVIGHAHQVILKDVDFKVSEAGRQRVLREQKKNVHAGVIGRLIGHTPMGGQYTYQGEWMYNPYKSGQFFDRHNGKPAGPADYGVVRPTGITTWNREVQNVL